MATPAVLYDETAKARQEALFARNAEEYRRLCDLADVEPEDQELYRQGDNKLRAQLNKAFERHEQLTNPRFGSKCVERLFAEDKKIRNLCRQIRLDQEHLRTIKATTLVKTGFSTNPLYPIRATEEQVRQDYDNTIRTQIKTYPEIAKRFPHLKRFYEKEF